MKKITYFILVSLFSLKSFGHGENVPGPNGGFIRMPSAFHTELVPDKKNKSFHLFLLDLSFKNPTIKNSSVEAVLVQKQNKKITFSCEAMTNNYYCKPDKDYKINSGKLILKVQREGVTGTSEYQLPLKWEEDKDSDSDMDHSGH